MNILLFTLEYPPTIGGISNYYENLVKFWPRKDRIFVLNNNSNHLISSKLPIFKWAPSLFELHSSVKKNNVDRILVGHILPLGIVAYVLSFVNNIEYSVMLHGLDFSMTQTTWRKRFIAKKILNRAGSIICANSFTAKKVEAFLGSTNKINIVNPGISENVEASLTSSAGAKRITKEHDLENKYILITIGRLVRRKGFDRVINAIPSLKSSIPNLKYIIVGSGEDQQYLTKLIEKNELQQYVLLLNDVSDEEKNIWLSISDCFIMVSRDIGGDYEGFGIVYLEASMYGLPVIAGDSGGVKDVVRHGENGILINPENQSDISRVIQRLFIDVGLRKKLGQFGRKNAINNHSWKKQIQKIKNCLQD